MISGVVDLFGAKIINHSLPQDAALALLKESASAVLKRRKLKQHKRVLPIATFVVTVPSGDVRVVVFSRSMSFELRLKKLFAADERHLQQLGILRDQIIREVEKELADAQPRKS